MAHITIASTLPGITGLLESRLDTSEPIRDLTQFILRGPNTLTEGERELIATIVSSGNACVFCTNAHASAAARYGWTREEVDAIVHDPSTAPVSEKVRQLLLIARALQRSVQGVSSEMVEAARSAGATDVEIHDTVLITSLFCLYNRYVDGLASDYPATEDYYEKLADRLTTNGYTRNPSLFPPANGHSNDST